MSNIYMSLVTCIFHKHLQLSESTYLVGRTTKAVIRDIRFPSLNSDILNMKQNYAALPRKILHIYIYIYIYSKTCL
jgi:hypothetical protein